MGGRGASPCRDRGLFQSPGGTEHVIATCEKRRGRATTREVPACGREADKDACDPADSSHRAL